MEQLSNAYMKDVTHYPTKVVQIGEGNFMRAFVDWQIQQMNKKGLFKGGVMIVKPRRGNGSLETLKKQDYLYTVLLEGKIGGQNKQVHEIVTSVNGAINPYEDYQAFLRLAEEEKIQFVFSNTTEAGITYHEGDRLTDRPPEGYPAKLTAFLYHRFRVGKHGLYVIPCELTEDNGRQLQKLVCRYAEEWKLGQAFSDWLTSEIIFCPSLVDRIVPGFPEDRAQTLWQKWGYRDDLTVKAESYLVWIIEGPEQLEEELPLKKAGLNVIVTDHLKPYRDRKVSLLNGPHTTMACLARLAGVKTVGEVMEDPDFYPFIDREMKDEIIPTMDFPKEQLIDYASGIQDRFRNPYMAHQLDSIALNSVAKYRARLLPTLLKYVDRFGKIPQRIALALAGLLVIYRNQNKEPHADDLPDVLKTFSMSASCADYVPRILAINSLWGLDLTAVPGLLKQTEENVQQIESNGVRDAVKSVNKGMLSCGN